MAHQIVAYKSGSGAIFDTLEQAENDEIRSAADVLEGAQKNHLINVALGKSTCTTTRQALIRLARAAEKNTPPEEAAPTAR